MNAEYALLSVGALLCLLGAALVVTSRNPQRNRITVVFYRVINILPWPRGSGETNALINGVGLLIGGLALLVWFVLALFYAELRPFPRP